MIRMRTELADEELARLLVERAGDGSGLTAWGTDFVDGCIDAIEGCEDFHLTDLQREKVLELLEELDG